MDTSQRREQHKQMCISTSVCNNQHKSSIMWADMNHESWSEWKNKFNLHAIPAAFRSTGFLPSLPDYPQPIKYPHPAAVSNTSWTTSRCTIFRHHLGHQTHPPLRPPEQVGGVIIAHQDNEQRVRIPAAFPSDPSHLWPYAPCPTPSQEMQHPSPNKKPHSECATS